MIEERREERRKRCSQIFAKALGNRRIEREVDKIALSKQTFAKRIDKFSHGASQQVKDLVPSCICFSLSLDESTDICNVAKSSIFIRTIDNNFRVFEKLFSLII